jgi:hypothetical protein
VDTGRTRRPRRRAKMLPSCHRRPGAWSFPPCAYAWPAVTSNFAGGPGVAATYNATDGAVGGVGLADEPFCVP